MTQISKKVTRNCALRSDRHARPSRSAQRAEVRHADVLNCQPRSVDVADAPNILTRTYVGGANRHAQRTPISLRMSIRPKPARARWETRWPNVLADPFLQTPFRRVLPPRLVRGDYFVQCNQIPAGGQRGSRTTLPFIVEEFSWRRSVLTRSSWAPARRARR
jgi:hypothetical protein